jgi:hypothetical protein
MLPIETYKNFYTNIEDRYETLITNLLSFNEETLDKRITEVAAYHAFLGAVLAYAKNRYDSRRIDHDEIVSQIKADAIKSSSSKLSDAKLESLSILDPKVKESYRGLLTEEYRFFLCKNLYASVETLKDMLVQASSNRRAEIKLTT